MSSSRDYLAGRLGDLLDTICMSDLTIDEIADITLVLEGVETRLKQPAPPHPTRLRIVAPAPTTG
ncbi:hypothetical protein [Mycolicibacterium mengxianglii]|uniref:hypothetical protein n=1 Tax=Mycolicibacterium mengxianglii TaxID=2736649 RepID=UPI0018EF2C41|nr:hypothetical protein [Mycolicibacterium mengxianglii]